MSKALALSEKEIQELCMAGFTVERAADTGTAGFVWRHKDGASQRIDTPKHPPRRSAAQAWYECAQYHGLNVSTMPEPDWEDA